MSLPSRQPLRRLTLLPQRALLPAASAVRVRHSTHDDSPRGRKGSAGEPGPPPQHPPGQARTACELRRGLYAERLPHPAPVMTVQYTMRQLRAMEEREAEETEAAFGWRRRMEDGRKGESMEGARQRAEQEHGAGVHSQTGDDDVDLGNIRGPLGLGAAEKKHVEQKKHEGAGRKERAGHEERVGQQDNAE